MLFINRDKDKGMLFVPDNFKDKNICVMGLGYVGLTLATAMADVGFNVYGIEIRDEVLDGLKNGIPHFYEPGLTEHLKRFSKKQTMKFYKYIPDACKASVYIITVGTPLGKDKKVRVDMIEVVSREVARKLKEGDMVIMRSTVKIGITRKFVLPILKESGVKFDLAFCPERTLEGKALIEIKELPQIVGGIDLEASVRAGQIFQFLTPTVVRVHDLETAEMIKLIDNTQRDVHFAFANEVAKICDAVGVSATEVIQAGKLGYARTNLPMPGPVGGPCLEKDPHILMEGLSECGFEPLITKSARIINESQPADVVKFLKFFSDKIQTFSSSPVITLMGLAFKGRPATDDLRGTMALPVFNELKKKFPDVVFKGYDAVVSKKQIEDFGLLPSDNIEEAMKDASIVIILNNHPVFSAMPIEDYAGLLAKPGLIYDFWNNFNARALHLSDDVEYISLGSHGCSKIPGGNK